MIYDIIHKHPDGHSQWLLSLIQEPRTTHSEYEIQVRSLRTPFTKSDLCQLRDVLIAHLGLDKP